MLSRNLRIPALLTVLALLAIRCSASPRPAELPTPFPTGAPTSTPPPTLTATPTPSLVPSATPTAPTDTQAAALTAPAAPPPTDTPPPTPTPTPWQPVLKESKWGLGVYMQGGRQALEALMQAQPGVILLMNPNWKFAEEVRHYFPKALIIGRLYFPEQPLDNPDINAVAAAEKIAEHALATRDWVDAWMSYNEPVGRNDFEGYRRWARFQVVFADYMHNKYGLKVVGGNDYPGAIEPQDYPRYFARAIRKSDYFGVHLYAHPDARSFTEQQPEYWGLRYRLIHDALEAAGITDVRMVATETGLWAGWRDKVPGYWMADQFSWLTREMERDPYMLGHMAFGIFEPRWEGWQTWQLLGTDVLPLMGSYQPNSG